MILEGVISNVTNFGAFVDIGVHQDGLVHISALTHKFVKDPRSVVKAGDVVKVKVIEVDKARRRISLSMKLENTETKSKPKNDAPIIVKATKREKPKKLKKEIQPKTIFNTAMADALAKLKRGAE